MIVTDTPGPTDSELAEVFSEFARIGFGMYELGGLALTESASLARFRDLLREIPTGAGFAAFCERVPDGTALWAAYEERLKEDRAQPTTCSFCLRSESAERRLILGPNHVAICSDCVRLADKHEGPHPDDAARQRPQPPKEAPKLRRNDEHR